ncbi:BTB domain-containing protein [Mycena kentingensis (nom. inval.)]|nr:BTB domain-containing protein [Mycena kentingensis (nom. inval.)]
MSTDAPHVERRREDENDALIPVKRSPEYWFDDGNIILQVESTQFRVMKSVLAMHSAVFADMFKIPTPVNETLVDGCPVVVLVGDTAQDWLYLFSEIFPKRFLRGEKSTISRLAALLRLGKKYDFTQFRQDCLAQLKEEFPTTLENFDKTMGWTMGWKYIEADSATKEETLVSVINLARELGLYSILPAAFYSVNSLTEASKQLSISDRLARAEGHLRLLRLKELTVEKWLCLSSADDEPLLPCGDCVDLDACTTALHKAAYNEMLASSSEAHDKDAVLNFWDEASEDGFCAPCVEEARASFGEGRVECWNQLPAIFGLPNWDELRKMDFE